MKLNSRRRVGVLRPCLLLVASFTLTVTEADESEQRDARMEASRWVAAKFLGQDQWAPAGPSLTVSANYGAVQKNGRGDALLNIAGRQFHRGFYCHAPSRLVVKLPSPGKTFSAHIGVDSNSQTRPERGSVAFVVKVAEQELLRSATLREGMAAVPLNIDLQGAMQFDLEVEDGGDGISCDQADWADARIALDNGDTIWLDDLPMVELQRGPHTTDMPFSFVYGDTSSADLIPQWRIERATRKLDDQRVEHAVTCSDPETGLIARCIGIEYLDFPTVEWTLHFQNAGSVDTPILSDIQALDTVIQRGPGSEFVLHHQRGDSCTPDSFEPLETTLEPNGELRFAPSGGRPTNGQWPYYNIRWGQQGLIAVVGWPGQWGASFRRDESDELRVRAGQELTHFTLHPGEEIRSPLIVLQFCRGDRLHAQNIWRRWMLAHNVPRVNGQPPAPIYSACSGGFFPGLKCNEADELRFIDTFTREGVQLDYWWMDAGWYPCEAWPSTGTWEVDRTRFPRGIRAVSDHAHDRGIKLILWFEPERVSPGTWLYEQRPQWLLGADGGQKLLNLGDQAARAWLTDHVDRLITEQGIDLYRQDHNIDPLPFWRAADAEDRQGITEIRHVEGYLAYWDQLRRRHPDMLIDSCASGGRRNDLETMRRAVPLLRSDYQSFAGDVSYAAGNQGQTYGLASWLPYFGTGVYYTNESLLYCVRSHFCPAFGFCADVRRDDINWDLFRRVADDWHGMAPSMLGDYYPLTPYSLKEDVWIAWQFHRIDLDSGVVQAFRRGESIYESARLPLRGLAPDARYRITNRDEPGTMEKTGRELAEEGVGVVIQDRPGAVILTYQRVE